MTLTVLASPWAFPTGEFIDHLSDALFGEYFIYSLAFTLADPDTSKEILLKKDHLPIGKRITLIQLPYGLIKMGLRSYVGLNHEVQERTTIPLKSVEIFLFKEMTTNTKIVLARC